MGEGCRSVRIDLEGRKALCIGLFLFLFACFWFPPVVFLAHFGEHSRVSDVDAHRCNTVRQLTQ